MSTGWNSAIMMILQLAIINLLGNEYWLELVAVTTPLLANYKPTGK